MDQTVIYDYLNTMDKKTPQRKNQEIEDAEPDSNGGLLGQDPSSLRKKPWSEEEDMLVKTLVDKYGPQRWSFIAKFVPGRLGKQCR